MVHSQNLLVAKNVDLFNIYKRLVISSLIKFRLQITQKCSFFTQNSS